MLTAESEGGQRKSHPYWVPDTYGPMRLKMLSERKVSLDGGSNTPKKLSPDHKKPALSSPLERPTMGRRRSSNPYGAAAQASAPEPPPLSDAGSPYAVVRKLALSHASHPFEPMREITQLQYSNWPDFGAPAKSTNVLGLVEHCNAIVHSYSGLPSATASLPAKGHEWPILVHCSAGCGRTGTFCTVDSVIDMLKRQREVDKIKSKAAGENDNMDVDDEEWIRRDDIDLIAKTVEDFRRQRLSMVQTLRQYVLCYETILEWTVKEMPEKYKSDDIWRSYRG